MKPGATNSAFASMTSIAVAEARSPIATMKPLLMPMSASIPWIPTAVDHRAVPKDGVERRRLGVENGAREKGNN